MNKNDERPVVYNSLACLFNQSVTLPRNSIIKRLTNDSYHIKFFLNKHAPVI